MVEIEGLNPRTGRLVKENGDVMNIADAFEELLAAGEVTTIDITAIGAVTDDTVVSDPAAVSATVVGLLRGILDEVQTSNAAIIAELEAQTALLTTIAAG